MSIKLLIGSISPFSFFLSLLWSCPNESRGLGSVVSWVCGAASAHYKFSAFWLLAIIYIWRNCDKLESEDTVFHFKNWCYPHFA